MSAELLIRPEAEAELAEAYGWYESQRPGLGDELLRAVEAKLAAVCRTPEAFAPVHRRVRRALIRRFPYGVFYTIDRDGQRVVVLAVMHMHRDPQQWQRRAPDE